MSQALIDAAREVGIGLTLLPTLYQRGGFDDRALAPRQRRFGHATDAFIRLVGDLRAQQDDSLRIGLAFHSLRAVDESAMREVLRALGDDVSMPIHIHIAEQAAEVDESLALRGARPVRWLLDNFAVGPGWTLVHATHLDPGEVASVARSGATVALCPTTEGNLGDGFFPLPEFIAAGGRWGIGSDSHVSISPVEELRWLEYGQRLLRRARNLAASPQQPSSGESLLTACMASAAASSGVAVGALAEGQCADFIVLDADAIEFAELPAAQRLDAWLFAAQRPCVREVYVAGRRLVADGQHVARDAVAARYRKQLATLFG
jgi:formimidoylglutamate deiminase